MKALNGIVVPLSTPLLIDERVDEIGLKNIISYVLDAGVDGIFILGSNGEFPCLRDKEKERLMRLAVKYIDGRVPVFAGVSDNSTKRVIDNIKVAENSGVDYVISVLPYYYNEKNEGEGIKFFTEIADYSSLPILIYEIPLLTKRKLTLDNLRLLARNKNIVGLKDTTYDFERFKQIVSEFKNDNNFSVFQGDGGRVIEAVKIGCDGLVLALSNVLPKTCVKLYQAALSGNFDKAHEYEKKYKKIRDSFQKHNIDSLIGIKYILSLLGICGPKVVSPFIPLKKDEKKYIKKLISDLKLLKNT